MVVVTIVLPKKHGPFPSLHGTPSSLHPRVSDCINEGPPPC
jgi:hypothetical protein